MLPEISDDQILGRRRRRRRRWFWLIALLLVFAGGGYYGYRTYFQPPPVVETAEAAPTTAPVRRGDLVVTVSGVGTLLPAHEINLSFRASGMITDVAVQVGDRVAAGQQLAVLDDSAQRAAVLQAELAQRQAHLQLTALTKPAEAAAVAAAKANLTAAEADLATLTKPPTDDELDAARNELARAQQTLATLLRGLSTEQKATLEADRRLAEAALQQAQAAYDLVAWQPAANKVNEAAALQNATITFEKAEAQYKLEVAGPTEEEISAARAQLAQAQTQLNQLLAGADASQNAASQARVTEAQAQLDDLLDGPAADEVELAELAVEQAEHTLATAQAALVDYVLTAPVTGTVTALNVEVGEQGDNNAAITLAELASTQVRFWIEEADAVNVALSNPVQVIFEAYPTVTFSGTVVRIDPTLVTVDGAAALQVWASIDMMQHPVNLLYGMNAEVEVTAGAARNALLVPVEALRELTPGVYAVFITLSNGELEMRPVEVGLKDFVSAEIRSGLEGNETVNLGEGETSNQ